jgi:hypothetical protein
LLSGPEPPRGDHEGSSVAIFSRYLSLCVIHWDEK